MKSKQRIMFGCYAMVLAIIGDYLLGLVTIGWIGMVIKGLIPVKKVFLICCPVCGILFGQLLNLIAEGMDSGTESFGWLVMYLVCAICLTKDKEIGG